MSSSGDGGGIAIGSNADRNRRDSGSGGIIALCGNSMELVNYFVGNVARVQCVCSQRMFVCIQATRSVSQGI